MGMIGSADHGAGKPCSQSVQRHRLASNRALQRASRLLPTIGGRLPFGRVGVAATMAVARVEAMCHAMSRVTCYL